MYLDRFIGGVIMKHKKSILIILTFAIIILLYFIFKEDVALIIHMEDRDSHSDYSTKIDEPINNLDAVENSPWIILDDKPIYFSDYIDQAMDKNGNYIKPTIENREYFFDDKALELKLLPSKEGYYVYKYYSPISISQPKDRNIVSLVVNNNLYLLDIDKNQTKMISKTKVNGYSKEELENIPDTPVLDWVNIAKINSAGTKIIFDTNRRGFKEGFYHIDIWVHDLLNDSEEMIVEDARIIRWIDDSRIAYKRQDPLTDRLFGGIYNLNTSESKEIELTDPSTDIVDITNQYVIYLTRTSVVFVPFSGDEIEVKIPNARTVYEGRLSSDENWVAFLYHTDKQHIGVVNIPTLTIDRIIDPPVSYVSKVYFNRNGKIITTNLDSTERGTWIEK